MNPSRDDSPLGYVRNQILRCLRSEDLQKILPQMEIVVLPLNDVIQMPDQAIDYIYFVESGTVSMIASLEDGSEAEVGLVGREGIVGTAAALGTCVSDLQALVQVGAKARRISANNFRLALDSVPDFRSIVLQYVSVFHYQVSRTAACNSRHQIEQRLARWILMTADRVEADEFPMTQLFMSRMLGVERPSVTLVVRTLQRAGLIETRPSWLKILDRPAVEALACECYAAVNRRFAALTDFH